MLPAEIIQHKIFFIRGHKVMFADDLAKLYGVPTKQLTRQVRRNIKRFPGDFMFQLNKSESDALRCQIGTLKQGQHFKYLPLVFTEQGVAMLSSVLNSERAVQVNIQIVRIFAKLREMMISHKDLAEKIEALEKKFAEHDKKFLLVFDAIKQLLQEKKTINKKKGPMGFVIPPKMV